MNFYSNHLILYFASVLQVNMSVMKLRSWAGDHARFLNRSCSHVTAGSGMEKSAKRRNRDSALPGQIFGVYSVCLDSSQAAMQRFERSNLNAMDISRFPVAETSQDLAPLRNLL